jgi:hypothetical protein
MIYKEIFTAIALVLALVAYVPYIRFILRGQVKPHVFSWVIWGAVTSIAFFGQLADGGGLGAWPIGLAGLLSIVVAVLAYLKKSDMSITRLDWVFFLMAIAGLPIWFMTSDPLWAVVISTTVDLLAAGPTVRKTYANPYEEDPVFFSVSIVRNVFALIALEHYSVTTMLFPLAICAVCMVLVVIIFWRRRVLVRPA